MIRRLNPDVPAGNLDANTAAGVARSRQLTRRYQGLIRKILRSQEPVQRGVAFEPLSSGNAKPEALAARAM